MRHARRWCGYGALVLLIGLALVVAVANQLLPMVERNPDRISAWLSLRVGEPVRFSRARAEWTRGGPRFILDGLRVGVGANSLLIGRAELKVAMYSGLLPGHPLTELKIRDLSLGLVQDPDGRWRVVGLPGQEAGDPLDRLEGFGELQIEQTRLAIRAPALKLSTVLPRVDVRMRVDGPRVRVGVSGWSDLADLPLSAVLDMDRRRGNGVVWVGGKDLRIAHWAPLLATVGMVPQQGHAEIGLWARLRDRRIDQVTAQVDLREAVVGASRPIVGVGGQVRPVRVNIQRLRATARWEGNDHAWRLQVPTLRVTRAGHESQLDKLVAEGGAHYSLRGDDLDLAPLAALLSLSDRWPAGLRAFLIEANPQARLRRLRIAGVRGGPMRGTVALSEFSMQAVGQRPGLSGLSGQLQFDGRGGVLRLGQAPVRLRWPVGLRQPLDLRLDGTLALWRDGPGWTVGSQALRVRGEDFGMAVRLQLGFQGDGTRPTLDLGANLDPATVATAKKFWIMHKMSPATVRWLDNGLVEGQVLDGRIAIGGDLDDWPFRDGTGAFDARASLRDATVKFSRDWPAGTDMGLDLVFDGPGFSLAGTGNLLGNPIASVTGGIAKFSEGILRLQVASASQGEQLRQLLLASPLDKEYGDNLRNARIGGPAQVAVDLELSLKAGATGQRVEGTVDLRDGRLADPRWGLDFTRVTGRTHFDRGGFATDNLAVSFEGQPAVFNLRVGKHTGEAGIAALGTLDGRFSAASLIGHAGDLDWLKPWMIGTSAWKLAVRVPASVPGGRTPPARLGASSDLLGTALLLPAPLRKPEAQALHLDVQAPLPIEQGEIALRLGTLMRLRAQMHKNAPMGGTITFGDATPPAMPAQGLAVRGNVALLDATAWVGFNATPSASTTTTATARSGTVLQSADVQAQQLLFLDRGFADAHLSLVRGAAQTRVAFKGTGIEGTIDVPADATHAVQGRFARLYLPSDVPPGSAGGAGSAPAVAADKAAATPASATQATAPSTEVENPGSLPPLRFDIADLRIGAAQLGKASLQTTPIGNGLRVDKFQTEAKNLALSAAGEWVRSTGGGTRSNFRLDFSARSLGQMLDALGFADMVQGGATKATLTGSWPGSPGAFGLSTLSGTLKADVGEGRLLDVEPGGSGRILGLLSLAEIPRRLSLDFSDFFEKGFAFNSARGDFSFSDGKARTENLRIDGPAAEIRVSGATGMRDQVYDQRVEVLPKAGGLLPAIGMLTGGPVGAAVGAMAQAVLSKPLKQSTRVVYRVTGPWAKPVVKVIEKGPSRGNRAAAGDAPAGAP
jgi:uncharacterized protein (TIGR02099 family)